jgi:hypothetical protein
MRNLLVYLAIVLVPTVFSIPTLAHHGFGGRYDEDNPITMQGTVTDFQFTNPHSFIYFDSMDTSGKTQRWQAELGSVNQLHMNGWTKDTLKPGDKITLTGPRAKNGSNDLNLSHESKIVLTETGKVLWNNLGSGNRGPQSPPPAAPY